MAGKERRVEYIDLFRSFGIILMIMGHIKYGNHFDKWIHAFHMPMFFFVSGWFYRSREDVSVGVQIKKKVNSLLVPYLFFEIVQWLILLNLYTRVPQCSDTVTYFDREHLQDSD